MSDLISREALKKFAIPCDIHNGALTELCVPLYQIDIAPTVEPEITEKQAILLLINNGWLVNHDKELREKWERPQGEWIPITYRPMTEEEVKRVETYFGLPLDEEDKKCFSCPMPEHGQDILISTKWGVSKDICLYDCDEGYGLDERGDWEDVDAWMPLPEKYDGADTRGDHHED